MLNAFWSLLFSSATWEDVWMPPALGREGAWGSRGVLQEEVSQGVVLPGDSPSFGWRSGVGGGHRAMVVREGGWGTSSPALQGLGLLWAGRWRLWQKTKLTQKHHTTCSTEIPACKPSEFLFGSVRIRHRGESFGTCTHLTVTVCPCPCGQLIRAYQRLEAAQVFSKRYEMFRAF